tara:strand:- start:139 stop:1695 length:1557 start_codon:yes stop_codon:yes gene_type:complete
MDCFFEIMSSNKISIFNNILILIISIIISIIAVMRSFYIGKITQNRRIKDIYIFIGIVISYYIFDILSKIIISNNLSVFNYNYVKNITNKIFNGEFNSLLEIKDNILNNLNVSITEINNIYQDTFEYYVKTPISIIVTTIIFMYYMPKIAYIIIISIIIISLIYAYLLTYLSNLWKNYILEYRKFNKIFQNIILNMWNVKYNSLEKYAQLKIKNQYKKRIELFNKYSFLKIFISKFPSIVFFIIFILNLFYIVKNKNISISISVFLTFQLYKVWNNYSMLCKNIAHLYSDIKNINKICPAWFLDELTSKNIKINSIENINFDDVEYSYFKNKNKIVLNNLNFNIKKGEIIYINGESGKGKSTIINLICRLFDSQKGIIKINEHNIKDIDINSLRKNISVIPQKINVFNESIKNNIIIDNEFDENKLIKLIKLLNLPDYNNNAMNLSHGQKQRVLIGRTLYNTNKSVYIFDEYLSSVDKNTSNIIHKYVIKFLKNNKKIGIFITHNNNEKIYYDKSINI